MALIIWYFRTIIVNEIGLRLGLFYSLAFSLVFLSKNNLNGYGTKAIFTTLLLPGFHFSMSLISILAMIVFIKLFFESKNYLKPLLFILLFLIGVSDALIFIYFIFPMLAALTVLLLAKELHWKKYLNLCSWLILAFLASYVTYRFLPVHMPEVSARPAINFNDFLAYFKTIYTFFKTEFVFSVLWSIFVIWAPISLWKSYKSNSGLGGRVNFVILFQFLIIAIGAPLLILLIGTAVTAKLTHYSFSDFLNNPSQIFNLTHYYHFRYLVNYFVFPVCFGLTVLIYKHTRQLKMFYKSINYFIFTPLIIMGLMFLPPYKLDLNKITHFQSDLIRCFNQYAIQYDLNNGITDNLNYVNAMNAYAKLSTHIVQVTPNNFKPSIWLNTSQYYRLHDYDFIFSRDEGFLKEAEIHFGKPTARFTCESRKFAYGNGPVFFYVYNDGRLNRIFDKDQS
jgi:hypothetical protein